MEYAATIKPIYDTLRDELEELDNEVNQCTEQSTCFERLLLPKKIPMLRLEYSRLTLQQYLEFANLSIPFIITGATAVDGRPGLPDWTLDRLQLECGHAVGPLKLHDADKLDAWARVETVTIDSLDSYITQLKDPSIVDEW